MIATSPLAGSQFSYNGGTSGTVTVLTGKMITLISCYSAAGGTLTIAPGGANQVAPPTAGDSITIPAGVPWSREWPMGGPLGPATVLVFTGTDSYYVEYAAKGVAGLLP